ncbi:MULTISPECIES: NAD-dependent epimerase/dehydratase family protein [unclassified Bacillus (in: firmicutes)]|uniref:NAD-dependent epimerase/dehydratase family protein n=1 Tax=unclassified Bacillus (in: firmicutes) TaxID=185979 RepID=UPI0008F388EE|nr:MULTISPECIES: NAD-dependent epimerase/dehydratase family protein [unclassified Bacillus (in: firmicutes)]SFI80681.1 Nucleoside-diphosphate-sugar epimerase [Bacillus sp. 71mf]SFS85271.1 Nucleoside-diphosphate-sugar epimerase [Bacillus sp. 103mf]
MVQILVMGGTQFVSEALAKFLISKGYEVDIFTRGTREITYEGVRTHLIGDRNVSLDIQKNISDKQYDFIFDITAYHKNHVKTLLDYIDTSKLKRYVLCSSGAVYAPSNQTLFENFERTENYNWGQYGLDKKEAEDYLFSLHKQEGFPITIFRPSYIYGEGNNLYREAYIFDRLTKTLTIPIPKNVGPVQFVHIDDVVQVMESVIGSEQSNGQAYNLSYPEDITWKTLVDTASHIVGIDAHTVEIDETALDPAISTRNYFPFRNVTYTMNIEKLNAYHLYVPQVNLHTGLQKAYHFYQTENIQLSDANMNKVDEVLRIFSFQR